MKEQWDRDRICAYLHRAIQGTVKYSDALEAIDQAKSYLATVNNDSTIEGHLNHLYPSLGWLKDMDDERRKLDKERKSAFRKGIIGTIIGAIIGLFGSIVVTYFTVLAQSKIADDSSKLNRELASDLTKELNQLKGVIHDFNEIESKKNMHQEHMLKTLDKKIIELEKNFIEELSKK